MSKDMGFCVSRMATEARWRLHDRAPTLIRTQNSRLRESSGAADMLVAPEAGRTLRRSSRIPTGRSVTCGRACERHPAMVGKPRKPDPCGARTPLRSMRASSFSRHERSLRWPGPSGLCPLAGQLLGSSAALPSSEDSAAARTRRQPWALATWAFLAPWQNSG